MNKSLALSDTPNREEGADKMKKLLLVVLGVAAAVMALPARG